MKLFATLAEMNECAERFGFFDDFEWYISPHLWTGAGVGVPTINATGVGGRVNLATGAVDNQESILATTNAPFLFADDKPLAFMTRIDWTEPAANATGIAVGFGNVLGTTAFLLDDGAGLAATGTWAVIYKVDGATVWSVNSGVGALAAHNNTVTQHAVAIAAQTVRLAIEVKAINTTQVCVTYYIDPTANGAWQQMLDASNRPIAHYLTYTSAAAMKAGVNTKAGAAAGHSISCDFVGAYQKR
jgi:hypothetical protein